MSSLPWQCWNENGAHCVLAIPLSHHLQLRILFSPSLCSQSITGPLYRSRGQPQAKAIWVWASTSNDKPCGSTSLTIISVFGADGESNQPVLHQPVKFIGPIHWFPGCLLAQQSLQIAMIHPVLHLHPPFTWKQPNSLLIQMVRSVRWTQAFSSQHWH